MGIPVGELTHRGTKRLETERLILRRLRISDGDAMFVNWANDPEVVRYLTWPVHENVKVSQEAVQSIVGFYEQEDAYQWAITLKDEADEPIGGIAVFESNSDMRKVEIGYCIGSAWWNRGIMSEALAAVIHFFFTQVGMNRIEARHDPRNPASGKVLQNCGMQYEGTLRQSDLNNQGIADSAWYAILAQDYQK